MTATEWVFIVGITAAVGGLTVCGAVALSAVMALQRTHNMLAATNKDLNTALRDAYQLHEAIATAGPVADVSGALMQDLRLRAYPPREPQMPTHRPLLPDAEPFISGFTMMPSDEESR